MSKASKRYIAHAIAFIVAVAFPLSVVLTKFPKESHGFWDSFGAGAIICLFVLLTTARKMVYNFVKDWLGVHTMPPAVMWSIFLMITFAVNALAKFMLDFQAVCVAGLVGAIIGSVIDMVANILWKEAPSNNQNE